jgi:hypothetical protein
MMATKNYDQDTYLGSIFFYLHFQYNGWFLLACLGLFMDYIKTHLVQPTLALKAFWMMFLSCIPAYFLSTLWADLPFWLYILVVLSASTQLLGWWYLVKCLRYNLSNIRSKFTPAMLILFLVVGLAISLKFLLQLGSTIPFISTLAFGFRPIVIAYLHLALLLITTLFLLTFMMGKGLIHQTRISKFGLMAFAVAAILTEFVLMIQGIAGFSYAVVPLAKEMLFGLALVLFGSAAILFFSEIIKDKNDLNQPIL